ncbi:MAG: transposase, partial [Candidatus Competibacteraceae bacterium]|nr:transposase [Candidatus Competibacteraceae bacterium]
ARTQGRTALSRPTQLRIQRLFDRIIAPAHQQHPHAERQQGQRGRIAQSDARNLLDRLIAYKDAYLRFLTDFAVPFDNNLAERDIRMAKLQQKISGSFRTDRGADIFCRIRGYISTLRKQHHDLFSALTSLWLARPFFPVPAC